MDYVTDDSRKDCSSGCNSLFLIAALALTRSDVAPTCVSYATLVLPQPRSSDTYAPANDNLAIAISLRTSFSAFILSDSAKNFATYPSLHSFCALFLPAIGSLAGGIPKFLFSGTLPSGSTSTCH